MSTWQVVSALVIIMIVGGIRQFTVLRFHINRHDVVAEFLDKFIRWCNQRATDQALYNWLLAKSEIVQESLGHSGLMNLRRPFEQGYHRNFPIILNSIPEIFKAFHDGTTERGSIMMNNLDFTIQSVDGCLRRYLGSEESRINREKRRLFNPFVWFGGGIRWLLEIPLILLSESGGLSNRRRTAIVKSRIFSFFSGSVSIAAFVATVMSIILGWDKCVEIVKDWLK